MFYKKGVLKMLCKIHKKTLFLESVFSKLAGLKPATLSEKRLW